MAVTCAIRRDHCHTPRGLDAVQCRPRKIHTDATQATGLDDFGTADYLEGLNRILDALNAASTLTDEGAPRR